MKLDELKQKLIAAARADQPSDRVTYAFEKRIMALIAARPVVDSLTLWSQSLWRAAVSCSAVVLVLGTCFFLLPSNAPTVDTSANNSTEELSQVFENTLLASVDQSDNSFEDWQ